MFNQEGSGGYFAKEFFIHKEISARKAAKDDLLDTQQILNRISNRRNSNLRRKFERIPVDSGADARKSDGPYIIGRREFKGTTVAGGQELRLAMRTALPNRTNGVDDELRGKAVALCKLGIAGLTPPEQTAFLDEVRPGGPVNGPVHAAPSEQGGVRSIDDGVNSKRRDVRLKRP
jgi:hypothetical protein